MGFVLNLIFTGAAWFISLFGLSNILIIMRFAKPFTKHLEKIGFAVNRRIYPQFTATQTLWAVILLALAAAVYWFFPYRLIPFIFGYVLALFSCWKSTGATSANFAEYIKSYIAYLPEELIYEYLGDDEKLNKLLLSFLCP